MIIDHVTGEITLEKLSSQIMVKKTRSEKPGSKLDDIVLPTPSSRPHTPNNFPKHDSYKSNVNKKVASEHKPGTMSIFHQSHYPLMRYHSKIGLHLTNYLTDFRPRQSRKFTQSHKKCYYSK